MLMVMLGILFVMSVQPMFMVGMLIVIVMLYSYMIYMLMGTYWFSYALMMVMLSGVLVIFTYMVSLIPNESFESYNLIYLFFLLILFSGYFLIVDNKWSLFSVSLWSSYLSSFNILMLVFLLGIMLVVVWMSLINWGALRSDFKGAWMKG